MSYEYIEKSEMDSDGPDIDEIDALQEISMPMLHNMH